MAPKAKARVSGSAVPGVDQRTLLGRARHTAVQRRATFVHHPQTRGAASVAPRAPAAASGQHADPQTLHALSEAKQFTRSGIDHDICPLRNGVTGRRWQRRITEATSARPDVARLGSSDVIRRTQAAGSSQMMESKGPGQSLIETSSQVWRPALAALNLSG